MRIKINIMKFRLSSIRAKLNPIKMGVLLLIAIVFSSTGMAQEVVIKIDRPIYEDLGMSSTTLFTVMLLFTIILILALIAIMNSTKNIYRFKRTKNTVKSGLILIGLLASNSSFAAEISVSTNEAFIAFPDSAFWAFMILDIIIVMLILYFIGLMRGALVQYAPVKKPKTIFSKWNKVLTNSVEIEDEASILLDHDYDGIKELDNDLPPWWKYGFYITIVWAGIYFGVYQVFGLADNQTQEYIASVEESKKEVATYKESNPDLITEETVTLLTGANDLAKGKKVFSSNCMVCHGTKGEGGIGPNLTDNNWIYNGDIRGVFATVANGANNGMAAWKELISSDKIQAVSSYILSFPAVDNGKEPQGENIFERP